VDFLAIRFVFRTKKGIVSYDHESGLWTTSHRPDDCIVYFGPVNPDMTSREAVNGEAVTGQILGFERKFVKGWHPLGVKGLDLEGIASKVRGGKISPVLRSPGSEYDHYFGGKILEVYKPDFVPLEVDEFREKIRENQS
jgi:hypothetical protein